jgi:transposase InsO family protein
VSHANAALTPRARLRLARLIVDQGWPVARAAERYDVSWPTADRWAQRYRLAGAAGMADRSSRPHHSPRRTPPALVRSIVHLRWRRRLGPVAIGAQLGVPASTVHAVLVRCRLNRLSHVDRRTGEPVRRYEHDHPGAMLHVDVKKLGNIPDGGGWRYLGRQQGKRNRAATPAAGRSRHHNPLIGTAFVHTVIDDHSRLAYAEIHDDETAATATSVLRRAVAWYAARGVTVERVLSDNGSAYRSRLWTQTCTELGIRPKRTRPYRPRPTARSNASTAHSQPAGPSPACSQASHTGEKHSQPGSTSTTITGPTPPSAASHPSAD